MMMLMVMMMFRKKGMITIASIVNFKKEFPVTTETIS